MRPEPDHYFIAMARLVATRSTCVRRSVGCVLVNARGHVLATGYNGVPAKSPHCNEAIQFRCAGANAPSGTQLDACLAVHAEQNAILQCTDAYAIAKAYITAFPCPSCAKLLLNTTCRQIVYLEPYGTGEAMTMWTGAGRTARQFVEPGSVLSP